LGLYSRSNTIRTVADKLRWTFGLGDEIKRLQTYLNVHIGTINIPLAEHGFARMDVSDENAAANAQSVRDRLDNTNVMVGNIDQDLQGQTLLLQGFRLFSITCIN
jgi:hypothetical protein